MIIEKNSRQIPKAKAITSDKDYCDLLYTWLQCNSERVDTTTRGRRISKRECKWQTIEKSMTRIDSEGREIKMMARKTIAKYFTALIEKGLVVDEGDEYYYLTVLENDEACLIENGTLMKLLNIFQRNCISIYAYLIHRYWGAGQSPYQITISSIKEHIGIATSTTSNNLIIDDTLDILARLGLIEYRLVRDKEGKLHIQIDKVKNKLD